MSPPARPVRVGGQTVLTRYAVPSGTVRQVSASLEEAGLGVALARIAARVGNPDPFPLRSLLGALLATDPGAPVSGCDGEPLTADGVQARLLRAALERAGGAVDPGFAGLWAFAPPGPRVRAVPVDGGGDAPLRWRGTDPLPPRVTRVETWTTAAIGDEAVATVRCIAALPAHFGPGAVALGSDYGLTLWTRDGFTPFPWPRGARREARRVEALAASDTTLHVGTSQVLTTWDGVGEPRSQRHAADQEDGYDDLLALLAVDARVLRAYRTRFEGGAAPPDVLCLAADPAGIVYAGTRRGELHVVDGGGPIRTFEEPGAARPRPVRHLAWADGALYVAAAGALHRFDGARWTAEPGEPVALATDAGGRLWMVREGALRVRWAGAFRPVPLVEEANVRPEVRPEVRPWSLGVTGDAVWVGGVGRVWRVSL